MNVIENYGGQFPVWVITELFTFGMLSYFYGDLPTPDQKQIAKDVFGAIPKNLVSWLRCCTDLRNICAHYGRLYFRIFTAIPANLPGLNKMRNGVYLVHYWPLKHCTLIRTNGTRKSSRRYVFWLIRSEGFHPQEPAYAGEL
jgi:abortive infection bacteriophage resistance protein